MNDPGWLDYLTAWATVGAAVFAAVAAGVAAWATRASVRSTRASEALVALEVERRDEERAAALVADVRAMYRRETYQDYAFDRPRTSLRTWLQVENLGPAVATDVRLTTNITHFSTNAEVPSTLHPGQRVDLIFVETLGSRARVSEVAWVDGRGPHVLHVPVAAILSD